MKLILRLSLLFLPVLVFTSCNSDDDGDVFGFNDIPGTYRGAMNVSDPSFSNALYEVVVTSLGTSSVKITPTGTAGTEWTATLSNIAGVYTCVTCVSQNQITFTRISGSVQLSYNYGGNNEQFAGAKQ